MIKSRHPKTDSHFIAAKLNHITGHDFPPLPGINLAVHLYHTVRDNRLSFAATRHEILKFENLEQFGRLLIDFNITHDGRTAPLFSSQRNPHRLGPTQIGSPQ